MYKRQVLYLRITMLGILGNMGYNFNAGLLRGIGNSSSSLLLLFISCAAKMCIRDSAIGTKPESIPHTL